MDSRAAYMMTRRSVFLKNLYQISKTMWSFGILGASSAAPNFSFIFWCGYQTLILRPTGKLRHQNVAAGQKTFFPSQPSLRIPGLGMGPAGRGSSSASRAPCVGVAGDNSSCAPIPAGAFCRGRAAAGCGASRAVLTAG